MKKHNWKKSDSAKSVQIAFDLEQRIARALHILAAQEGLTPSNQIRKLVGLTYSAPKRPRLTLSLSDDDYLILSKKYGIEAVDTLSIKRKLMQELIDHFQ